MNYVTWEDLNDEQKKEVEAEIQRIRGWIKLRANMGFITPPNRIEEYLSEWFEPEYHKLLLDAVMTAEGIS